MSKMRYFMQAVCLSLFGAIVFVNSIEAAPLVRTAAGADAASIQAAVDLFRADLGNLNPNNGQSFTSGRREINWDGAGEGISSPNNFPANFFNSNSPRGAVFATPCSNAVFRVSASAGNATNTPVRFGELDASYAAEFKAFSPQKLFTAISDTAVPCNIITVNFFIPGTKIPATVSGFGVIFTDVDVAGNARIIAYDKGGNVIPSGNLAPAAWDKGFSFIGVSYPDGERIASVQIVSGNSSLAAGKIDGANGVDVVATDDFFYGEPRAAEYHSSDFDGDGTSDLAVYRPSVGAWFVLGSGTNTFQAFTFGQYGDIPVDGDFDGDSRADVTVFRPSTGDWYRLNSSNGQFVAVNFGTNGDKPVPGDYDKDGRTDIAVWRPSDGNYFILQSSNGAFRATAWGTNGDVPIQAAPQ